MPLTSMGNCFLREALRKTNLPENASHHLFNDDLTPGHTTHYCQGQTKGL